MKKYGPYVAARTLRAGAVETLRAVDSLTGLPAVLYLLPAENSAHPPPLGHPSLLPYSDAGNAEGRPFVVCALPPASAPAADPWAAAHGALRALVWLHERGLLHGGLTPEQLWRVGAGVCLAGAGLPWGELGDGYDAPEGGGTPAADLYALGRTLSALGKLPERLEHLLDPDPAGRGNAESALARLQGPPGVQVLPGEATPPQEAEPETVAAENVEPEEVEPEEVEPEEVEPEEVEPEEVELEKAEPENVESLPDPEPVPPDPAPADPDQADPDQTDSAAAESITSVPTLVVIEAEPAPLPLLDDVFGPAEVFGPPVAETAETAVSAPPTPGADQAGSGQADAVQAARSPRGQPIRIGWEEDHSWRVVKTTPGPAPARRPLPGSRPAVAWPAWGALALGALLALIVIGALLYAFVPRAAVAAPCCAVTFELRGTADVGARLKVVRAPKASGLASGAPLGRVPGKVMFPNVPGRYVLRVVAEGYTPQNLTVEVPSARPVVIEVGR